MENEIQKEKNIYEAKISEIADKLSNYISKNYDMKLEKINLKYHHTFRVKDVNDEIVASLNLSERDKYLSRIIALFHDYARFEQAKVYDSFNDLTTRDHADWAVELLFDNNELENFVNDLTEEEKLIVKLAIKNHNKFAVEEGLSEREMLFCKLIRDADKIDIMYIFSQSPRCDEYEIGTMKQSDLDNFMAHKLYVKTKTFNFYNRVMLGISFIYDINFKQSFVILDRENYLRKYLYTLKLWANFKIDENLIKCFDYGEKYVREKAS